MIRYEGYFVNDKPVGEWKRFHQNGRLKAILFYSPVFGMVRAEIYDTEGILVSKGNYINNAKDSIWTYYNKNVVVARESYHVGLMNGASYSYLPDGKVISQTNWTNGKLDGISREYYPSGEKESVINYQDGKRQGAFWIFYESGNPQTEGQYKQDQWDGNWKYYNQDGSLKFLLRYNNGILLNPETVDSLQMKEFKAFDRDKGRLKDPEQYKDNPEEYPLR
jgi:antitoxin component YwqK of YwqJK toxin-antitoxin module